MQGGKKGMTRLEAQAIAELLHEIEHRVNRLQEALDLQIDLSIDGAIDSEWLSVGERLAEMEGEDP
jgi:hypothetical protein